MKKFRVYKLYPVPADNGRLMFFIYLLAVALTGSVVLSMSLSWISPWLSIPACALWGYLFPLYWIKRYHKIDEIDWRQYQNERHD